MKMQIPRRILTLALALVMLVGLMPAAALADDTGGATTTSGIKLSKTATLENDGTYTINLEAYATGTTTTTTTTSSVPLDIVLVIDQSGSMAYDDSGSSTSTESDRRYYKLKTALNNFVSAIQANAASTGADHRIAIAGFASDNDAGATITVTGVGITSGSDSEKWVNTGLYINGTMTPYGTNKNNTNTSLTETNYQNALVSANTNGAVTSSISTAITNMKFSGGTYTQYGLLMAQGVFANNSASYTYTDDNGETQTGTRKRIVILFTDGETSSSISNVLTASNALKSTYNATVYCVGFGSSVSDFLSYVSSNYGSDTKYSNGGPGQSSGYSGTSNNATKYSMLATSTSELSKIFETISTDVSSSSTSVTLGADAVMKDIMGDGFTLTSNSAVTITTVAGSVVDGEIVWGNETENEATASVSGNTVSVTGFNYAEKYISSGHEGEKICVTITGVLPTTDVTTDEAVNTNAATSGIYATADDTEATATFPQPQTIITKKLYVLDYAKTATLDGLDQSSITGIVDSYQAVSGSNSSLTAADSSLTYGSAELSGSTLTYNPTTTNWNGYDSFYVFGQTSNETVLTYTTNTAAREDNTANLWSKVSVIPANNVYYEDDFVTTYTDETKTETATVGIVYTGNWSVVDESSNNTETANGETHGWETTLADDTGDSDGSSHKTDTDGATATFTFTGTGVDIYSRTDMTTGTVYAKLTGTDENGTSVTKRLIVDDLAVSNGETGYYQIPTVSFEVAYGTYTVTLTVTNQADDGTRSTYYLDGIRVYNPLGTVTDDGSDAGDAYKANNELNAVFTEVRDILIESVNGFSADSTVTGAVFIDEINDTTSITTGGLTDYVTYGPKNEVYLAKNQAIVFQVDTTAGNTYYLGLKSADGKGTTATFTNGSDKSEQEIQHSTDLYYKVIPDSNGYIMVQNTGDNLLSITVLRTTNPTTENSGIVSNASLNGLVSYANSFSVLRTVEYTGTGVDVTETPETTEPETENPGEGDVTIENPSEGEQETEPEQTGNTPQSIFSSLFDAIRKWFNGRR